MAETVTVSVSGPALSFLLYENVKCPGDQVGFLLGAVMNHVTDTISDSHMTNETVETLVNIHSVMPFFKPFPFYNGVGRVDKNKLKTFVKDREKEVVGWYCFRRGTVLSPHLRDRLLHKELCAAMTHLSPDVLTLCLLGSAVLKPAVRSTLSFSHKFFRYSHRSFRSLSVSIQNLGGSSQSEYKTVPSVTCTSASFNSIVDTVRARYEDSSPKDLMLHMQQALQDHLRKLIADVEHVEKEVLDVQKEISSLCALVVPVPNEILLPELVKQGVSSAANTIEIQSPSCNKVAKSGFRSPCDNNEELIMSQCEVKKVQNYSDSPNRAKREASPSSSYDPFSFSTEMKTIDMGSSQSPVLVGTGKSGRGGGKGQRRKQWGGEPGGERPEGTQARRGRPGKVQVSTAKETIIPISVEEDRSLASQPHLRGSPFQSSSPQSVPTGKKAVRSGREGQSAGSSPGGKATSGQKTPASEAIAAAAGHTENVPHNGADESLSKEYSPHVVLIPVQLESNSAHAMRSPKVSVESTSLQTSPQVGAARRGRSKDEV